MNYVEPNGDYGEPWTAMQREPEFPGMDRRVRNRNGDAVLWVCTPWIKPRPDVTERIANCVNACAGLTISEITAAIDAWKRDNTPQPDSDPPPT